MNEPDLALGAELRRTFRAGGTKVAASLRTVAELRAAADELRAKRERARRVVGESGYYDYRAAGPLARLLELHIDLLEGTAASELERMAVHRVAMTVIIETMDRVDDSLADMSELFAASERRAATTHRQAAVTHRRASVTHRRASVTHRQASVTHRQASVMHRRASVTHRRASVTHQRASVTHRGASVTHRRAPVTHRRAAATHRRLTATHRGPTACPPAVLHP
ncbi:MAG TPA: hypothetical protein VE093_27960 [Polyangiaceae bacterium]|nr:hypothetical protein [Polyangiaceae bacterium]